MNTFLSKIIAKLKDLMLYMYLHAFSSNKECYFSLNLRTIRDLDSRVFRYLFICPCHITGVNLTFKSESRDTVQVGGQGTINTNSLSYSIFEVFVVEVVHAFVHEGNIFYCNTSIMKR